MASQNERRCIFCGRAKGDLVEPADPTSQQVTLTREHIFRETWQEKLDVDWLKFLPGDVPNLPREFTRYELDGSTTLSRPEPLFDLVVKPVCNYCNNGWLNDLDSVVEPWIFDPYADSSQCDPALFRRWAIKVGVLLSRYHHPLAPQPEDFGTLYSGDDIPDWHIFIGRTMLPNHSHTFAGIGPSHGITGGRIRGLTQVSWSLGRSYVIALRLVRDCDTATKFFKMFKSSNRNTGIFAAEVLPSAKELPSLAVLPRLSLANFDALVWYFSTNPRSPIAAAVRAFEDGWRQQMNELGAEYIQP